MQISQFIAVALLLFSCTDALLQEQSNQVSESTAQQSTIDSTRLTTILPQQIKRIEHFNNKHEYSNKVAFFIDMRIPSNHYRFFVVDLLKDSIVSKGLCAHGSGSNTEYSDSLQFSNTPNSYMTSLGIYKIGGMYQGNFGKSYKLHGLESSNSNAYKRLVVLHPYSCVPDDEQLFPICNSLGCPMLSDNFLAEVSQYITAEKKPVLMVIYY
jgi:hypothetical protein